jgi:hypothetical protein
MKHTFFRMARGKKGIKGSLKERFVEIEKPVYSIFP